MPTWLSVCNNINSIIREEKNKYAIIAYRRVLRKIKLAEFDMNKEVNDHDLALLDLTKHMTEKIKSMDHNYNDHGNDGLYEELIKITGIGEKLAQELSKKIKSIDELEKPEYFDDLPLAAQTFIKYKPMERIPRALIDELKEVVFKNVPDVEMYFVGSYRRGLPNSGDVDIMIVDYSIHDFIDKLTKLFDKNLVLYAEGKDKASFLINFHGWFKLDCFASTTAHKAGMLLYSTGSKENNIRMRSVAKKKSLLLNQFGLFKNNKLIELETEKDIYDYLGLKYQEPEER